MGHRTVKRVPLDFAYPQGEVWTGYLNPHRSLPCVACDNSGLNPATRQIDRDWYDSDGFGVRWTYAYGTDPEGKPALRPPWLVIGHTRRWCYDLTQDEVDALVEARRLYDLTHDFIPGQGWQPKDPPHHPTAAEVNRWALYTPFGHDGINSWICVKARAKRLGVYGNCAQCDGEGCLWPSPETKVAHEAWRPEEPPLGAGWQLWETTSEGSPVSPVFASPEQLAAWCADGASIFGGEKLTAAQWFRIFLEDDTEPASLMVRTAGYFGSVANMPWEARDA